MVMQAWHDAYGCLEFIDFTAQNSPILQTLSIKNNALRPPGGSITVFSTLFNKADLLSYAFTLDPYNPMVQPHIVPQQNQPIGDDGPGYFSPLGM